MNDILRYVLTKEPYTFCRLATDEIPSALSLAWEVFSEYESPVYSEEGTEEFYRCLPISIWINLCDREPERESEVMELVEKHIRQFFRLYQIKAR